MKKVKLMLFVALIGFVLMIGQGPGAATVMASSNAGDNNLSGNGFLLDSDEDKRDYNVSINYVGSGALDAIDESDDGSFHVESDAAITNVRIKFNISGYECVDCSITEDGNDTNDDINPYIGSVYSIIDGDITRLGPGALGDTSGYSIPLAKGDHSVTILYIGFDDNGDFTYASDNVLIRVRDPGGEFESFKVFDYTYNLDIDDNATSTENVTASPMVYNAGSVYSLDYFSWKRDDKGSLNTTDSTIRGNIDTSGFAGPHSKGFNYTGLYYMPGQNVHEATQGHYFAFDFFGAKKISENADEVKVRYHAETGKRLTQFGILAFSDFGYWNVSQDLYGTVGGDWDGFSDSFTLSHGDAQYPIFGSYDFIPQSYTFTVSDEIHKDNTFVTGTETQGANFTAVAAFVGLGAIAYVAPRMRKEEN